MQNSVIQVIAHTFLLAFAFGTFVFSPLVNTRLTGVGFFKLSASITLAALVLALGVDLSMDPFPTGTELACYGVAILSTVLTHVLHRDAKTWPMWVLYSLQVLSLCSLVFYSFEFNPGWINFFFLTAGLLGMSNFAMILGHYYLVVPKLTEEPLIYCLNILWVFLFLKIITSLSVLLSVGAPFLQEGTVLGDGFMYNWLFISMRILWGYVAPLVLSFFTYKLCRLRSIQSATGVLYIVEFFVIVGELIAIYLMTKHGLPI